MYKTIFKTTPLPQYVRSVDSRRRKLKGMVCRVIVLAGVCQLAMVAMVRGLSNSSSYNNAQTCQWTMILGDSNNRNAFVEWGKLEERIGNFTTQNRVILRNPVPPMFPKPKFKEGVLTEEAKIEIPQSCNTRWYDREMVILSSTREDKLSCHIVSFKFLRDQGPSIERLAHNLHSNQFCVDGKLEETIGPLPVHPHLAPQQWKRPLKPNMIWFTNGLWELPNVQQENCEERYELSIRAIQKWRSQGIRVIWQSLFPINEHPKITNQHIDWDYKCQKKLASQEGIELADLYRMIRTMGVLKVVNTYHLNRDQYYERLYIQPILDACCGGWEDYYGATDHLDEEKLEGGAVEFQGRCLRLSDQVGKFRKTLSTEGKTGACCDEMWECLRQ